MSKTATTWTIIIIILVVIGGWWYYNKSSVKVNQNPPAKINQASTTVDVSVKTSVTVQDNSDTALNNDSSAIDGQMAGLSSDNASADQSLK